MPLAARAVVQVHPDSARFRMYKTNWHTQQISCFLDAGASFIFQRNILLFRRSALQTLSNTVDNFADLRTVSKSWRALSRLTHPTNKKGPVSLPVPILPPLAAFCVSSVSAHITTNAQPKSEQRPPQGDCKGRSPCQIKARGSFHFNTFIMDNLKKNLLYFPTRIFSVSLLTIFSLT